MDFFQQLYYTVARFEGSKSAHHWPHENKKYFTFSKRKTWMEYEMTRDCQGENWSGGFLSLFKGELWHLNNLKENVINNIYQFKYCSYNPECKSIDWELEWTDEYEAYLKKQCQWEIDFWNKIKENLCKKGFRKVGTCGSQMGPRNPLYVIFSVICLLP